MATADAHVEHDDHHHDHGEFIAHHFDGGAQQQFDAGKMGIWLFLVTEVLFFSGLFVAYTLYRNHHPEIFEQAHVFLDKYLGGLNTIVLLFSSLTMALAVRAAQLGRNKNCGMYILITMVCAALFLGVKAIEYSHKWDMGITPASTFALTYEAPELTVGKSLGVSNYLIWLSLVPAVLLVGFVVASIVGLLTKKNAFSQLMLGLAITVGGYFLGAVVGHIYMEAKHAGEHGAEHHAAVIDDGSNEISLVGMAIDDETKPDVHDDGKGDHDGKKGDHQEGDHDHAAGESHGHGGHGEMVFDKHHPDPETLSRDVGIFFSIYYCMTGLHAIHIIGGIIALAWVYWRCILGHWRTDYFGPVDYVGLYWHLVDLIWIYLFPLLYLID
jgi:cytochrome c oxidase subunit 3